MDETLRFEDLPFEVISLILRYAQTTHTSRNPLTQAQSPPPRLPYSRNLSLADIPLCSIIANNNTLPCSHLRHPPSREAIPSRTRNARNIHSCATECVSSNSRESRSRMDPGSNGCSARDNSFPMGIHLPSSVPPFLDPIQTTPRHIPYGIPPNATYPYAPCNRLYARRIMDKVHHPA